MSTDAPAWPCAVAEATVSAAAAMRHQRSLLAALYGPGVMEALDQNALDSHEVEE